MKGNKAPAKESKSPAANGNKTPSKVIKEPVVKKVVESIMPKKPMGNFFIFINSRRE